MRCSSIFFRWKNLFKISVFPFTSSEYNTTRRHFLSFRSHRCASIGKSNRSSKYRATVFERCTYISNGDKSTNNSYMRTESKEIIFAHPSSCLYCLLKGIVRTKFFRENNHDLITYILVNNSISFSKSFSRNPGKKVVDKN